MKKLQLLKSMLLLFALIVGSSSVWAAEETILIPVVASSNSWEDTKAYSSFTINPAISVSCVTGGNNGKYYLSGNDWRHYESNKGAVTISITNGTLNSVTFTYVNSNNGVLIYNETNYTTGTECTAVSGQTSATFTVGHSSGSSNGNVQIKSIVVKYTLSETTVKWVATDFSDLTTGDVVVVVGDNGSKYAMSNENGTSNPTAVGVTVSGTELTSDVADNIKWIVDGNTTDGYKFYRYNPAVTWLYCNNANDGVKVGTGANKIFNLSAEGYLTTVVSTDPETVRYIGVYNSADWRCYTSPTSNNIKNQSFAFYKKVTSISTTIGSTGWSTFSHANALDFSNATPSNPASDVLKAYMVTGFSGTALTKSAALNDAPGSTGLLLNGTAGETYTIPVLATSSTSTTSNCLQASVSGGTVSAGEGDNVNYVLMNVGGNPVFQWIGLTSATLGAKKAYLTLANGPMETSAHGLWFDDETTGLNKVEMKNSEANGVFYNLAGQRVAQFSKGLYIVNGKKVVIK